MAVTILEVMFMKLEFPENAIFAESSIDISLLWLSFQLNGLPSHYQTE